MKLFRFTLGTIEHLAVFADIAEAQEKRATVEPVFDYTPVVIEEVTIAGYDVVVTPAVPDHPMSLEAIRTGLKEKGVKFPPNTGEARLRELAAEHL